MVVAIDLSIMFIVAVLRTKHRRAHRTSEVVDVIFPVEGRDV
jgi:hypothetical protein